MVRFLQIAPDLSQPAQTAIPGQCLCERLHLRRDGEYIAGRIKEEAGRKKKEAVRKGREKRQQAGKG